MQTSKDILDAVAKKLGGASDYRIGKETGIRQGTISNIRNGKCSLSADGCAACADILGVEAGALIAIARTPTACPSPRSRPTPTGCG